MPERILTEEFVAERFACVNVAMYFNHCGGCLDVSPCGKSPYGGTGYSCLLPGSSVGFLRKTNITKCMYFYTAMCKTKS